MNRIKNAKKRYDETPIPEELSERVMQEVEKANVRRGRMKRRKPRYWARGLAAAAAAMAVFVTALNTSTAFAQSVSEIPVIGTIAKVLTFRSTRRRQKMI